MRLNLTWAKNSSGANVPIVVGNSRTIHVELLDDLGAPLHSPTHIKATLKEGSQSTELEPSRVSGTSVHYRLVLRRNVHLRPARFEVEALSSQDRVTVRRTVISETEHLLTRAALVTLTIVALYVCLLFPQVETVLRWLKSAESLPIIGAVVVFAGSFAGYVRRTLKHPHAALAALLIGFSALWWVRSQIHFVVNHSLDAFTVGPVTLGPGERGVIWGFLEPSQSQCKVVPDTSYCVAFPSTRTALDHYGSFLLLDRIELGCKNLPIPPSHHEQWRQTGNCVPKDGLVVDGAGPEQLTYPENARHNKYLDPDRLVVHLAPQQDPRGLLKPDVISTWGLTFRVVPSHSEDGANAPPREPQLASTQLRLSMKGSGTWRDVETGLAKDPHRTMTPVPVAANNGSVVSVLEAQVNVGALRVGELTAALLTPSDTSTGAVANCWLIPTGTRLSGLVLRGAHGAVEWRAAASEFITELPTCWTELDRPEEGELQLDARWSPSRKWEIILPRELVPQRLSVLDGANRYWGELECKPDEHAWWRIGPLFVENPRKELARVENGFSKWQAADAHENANWFWACWPEAKPEPSSFSASGRWNLTDRGPKKYRAEQGLQACRLKLDGGNTGPCDTPIPQERKLAWFAAHGHRRPECHPTRSEVCQ